jgi:hypothetical protein
MAALDRSVLDAQVCTAKADACGTPQLRVVRAPNLPASTAFGYLRHLAIYGV